jgi:hypothetical protein
MSQFTPPYNNNIIKEVKYSYKCLMSENKETFSKMFQIYVYFPSVPVCSTANLCLYNFSE